MKKILTMVSIVFGVFLLTSAVYLILSGYSGGLSPALKAALCGAAAALLVLPAALMTSRGRGSHRYAAYALEEVVLNEEELNEAVANWIYVRYRKRMENESSFLEDEDGRISCRATVRAD